MMAHCKIWLLVFPSSDGMSLTKLPLAGNNIYIYYIFPANKLFGSDIPSGDGVNREPLFNSVELSPGELIFPLLRYQSEPTA
jgi:hypothetical protein